MSFDNRLIAARCIGGAWSLGEAHSQNERLWNCRLWPRKADVGMRKSFGSRMRNPQSGSENLTGPTTSRKDGTQAVFQDSNVVPHSARSKLLICRDGAIDSVRL
jgi:hypothetical protein